MDGFTPYGDSFMVGLKNLEKVLARCIQARVSLSTVKCHMMMEEGIILGHLISAEGIRMDPTKIQALLFHIHTNASQTAIGAVLGQQEDKVPYAIYYVSKNLALAELNYTVTEKEFLVVLYDINKFRHYITRYPTFVHTNHAAIRYLMNKHVTPGRITRWLLLLQEFDITIVDKLGKDNVVADFLSRIECDGKETPIEDDFPDEYLFAVSANTP
eukprot:PITA_12729